MPELRSGIFTTNEFQNRNVLKLAPDMFVTINGSLASRVVAPTESRNNDFSLQGGITSINVTAAAYPPGASNATIEIIAPQYKGLHEDYYITAPTGVRIPVFIPLMEVKVYMKGRFLDRGKPVYYPVFWGMILTVSESYSDGVHTFSLQCGDVLNWWKYQKITLVPSAIQSLYGAPVAEKFPTVFKNMNPWEIIYALMSDVFFVDKENKTYNFVYPQLSRTFLPPDFGDLSTTQVRALIGGLAKDASTYWTNRFGFGLNSTNRKNQGERVPFEMYGLRGPVEIDDISQSVRTFDKTTRNQARSSLRAKLDVDYNILARIQPYGGFDLYGDGSESLEATKLEIANNIVDQVHFEFFVDTNGKIVFKPPFYNLDVRNNNVYSIGPEDILSFGASTVSDSIVNFLECRSPKIYEVTGLENVGYFIDFESVKQFGIRYQKLDVRYGNNARSLFLIAAAEAAKINGRAFTASASIPLRPEMRLGYPVYIKHIDAFFYVTSITHSFNYGSNAQTDLGLEFRRDRVFDARGDIANKGKGAILDGYVYRFRSQVFSEGTTEGNVPQDVEVQKKTSEDNLEELGKTTSKSLPSEAEILRNELAKENTLRLNNILAGPKSNGFFNIDKAQTSSLSIENSGEVDAVVSNELLMITDETTPYTDINGYRHIGAFPYGANLKLSKKGDDLYQEFNQRDSIIEQTNLLNDASPETGLDSRSEKRAIPNSGANDPQPNDTTTDNAAENFEERVSDRRTTQNNVNKKTTPDTPDLDPDNLQLSANLKKERSPTTDSSTDILLNASGGSED